MFNAAIKTTCVEEKLVWSALVFTYVLYFTGTLYILGSALGWMLFGIFLLRWYVEGTLPKASALPIPVLIWIVGMMFMLVALLVAHYQYELGLGSTIKSSIGWAKGWALMALFPLLGAVLPIRPSLMVRACCLLSSQSILFLLLGLVAAIGGMDGFLYLSPLKAVGGIESSFQVALFGLNPESGRPRWSFFAPWAPAAGLMSCLFLIICAQEKDTFWRRMGMTGAFVMCLFCQSRAGWAIFIALVPAIYLVKHALHPVSLLIGGIIVSFALTLGQPFFESIQHAHQQVKDSRPDSTRVRNALASIAVQRWESEAPTWGHGVVERGPKMVEFMPIGSHHSWYGLLFVKGIVGLFALAVPLLVSGIYLFYVATKSRGLAGAFLMIVVFTGYSFFENLEVLSYLFWPALFWIGMAFNPLKEAEL